MTAIDFPAPLKFEEPPSNELFNQGVAPTDHSICVVIPHFQQERYLSRALHSVVPQLGPRDEVIVVDDGSERWPLAGLNMDQFPRVMWLREEINQGVSNSRNQAILRSRAEWIKFLDADDVLAPFALASLRNAIPRMPQHIQVVTGGCYRMVNGAHQDYLQGAQESLKNILQSNPILPSATFVKREALLEVGLFDPRIDFEEDWDLWLRLHEKFGLKAFAITQNPICYYWMDQRERNEKARTYAIEGTPVREYFEHRYGVHQEKDNI